MNKDKQFHFSPDELTELHRHTPFPIRFRPISSGNTLNFNHSLQDCGELCLWRFTSDTGLRMDLSAMPPVDNVAVTIPTGGAVEILAGGRTRASSGEVALTNLVELESVTVFPGRHEAGFTLSKSALRRHLSLLLDEAVTGEIEFAGALDGKSAEGISMAKALDLTWSLMESARLKELSRLRHQILATIPLLLLETIPHNYTTKLMKSVSPAIPKHLKRAIEFMHVNSGTDLDLFVIAKAAGASPRSLQQAFRHFKDTTPIAFLQSIRLREARELLSQEENMLSVAAVARRCGFMHMGRFSRLYYQTYGELPSSTAKARS